MKPGYQCVRLNYLLMSLFVVSNLGVFKPGILTPGLGLLTGRAWNKGITVALTTCFSLAITATAVMVSPAPTSTPQLTRVISHTTFVLRIIPLVTRRHASFSYSSARDSLSDVCCQVHVDPCEAALHQPTEPTVILSFRAVLLSRVSPSPPEGPHAPTGHGPCLSLVPLLLECCQVLWTMCHCCLSAHLHLPWLPSLHWGHPCIWTLKEPWPKLYRALGKIIKSLPCTLCSSL